MTKLAWGVVGQRFYEAGTDRGVLYVNGMGVAWNGLQSVKESLAGGGAKPFYMDGIKYLNLSESEEFAASLTAFSAPPEFNVCDGTAMIHAGLFITQQPRKPFDLAYRTMIGNDTEGLSHYKIHLVYKALAAPASRDNNTLNESSQPMSLSWDITTTPPGISGYKPSAHFVINSRTTPEDKLAIVEDILYGSDTTNPSMPTVDDLMAIFSVSVS